VEASDRDPTYVDRRARRVARHRNDSIASCRAVGRILMRRRATPAVQTAVFGPTYPALAQGFWRLLQGCRFGTQQKPRCAGVGSRSDLPRSNGAEDCESLRRKRRRPPRCRSHLDATPRNASGADGGFRSDLSGSRSRRLQSDAVLAGSDSAGLRAGSNTRASHRWLQTAPAYALRGPDAASRWHRSGTARPRSSRGRVPLRPDRVAM
jgi:hypothetical protein